MDSTLLTLLAVSFLILVSGFFSYSETCLTSLSDSKALAIIASDRSSAHLLKLWLEQPQRVLTTILIGNNIANILAPLLLAQLMQRLFGQAEAIAAATAVMLVLILVFGEITPKSLARQHAERSAVPVMFVLQLFYKAFWLPTHLFVALGRAVVRLLGGDLHGGQDITEAELQASIDLAKREGVVSQGKASYLQAIFEFNEREVREIMVARPDVEALDMEQDVTDLVAAVSASEHSRLPVMRGHVDEVFGVLHAKDLLELLAKGKANVDAAAMRRLVRQPNFVPETMGLDALLAEFRRKRQHLAIVLDEYGGTAGIVTLEDVLEELVGEIWDEHDAAEHEPALTAAGRARWTAPGRLPLSELRRALELRLPREPGFETLAGLLMDRAGEVPRPGSSLRVGAYDFEVLSGDERHVGLVRIERRERER